MLFKKPTQEVVKHVKPLFTKDSTNEEGFNPRFVDEGFVLDFMSLIMLKKLVKNGILNSNQHVDGLIHECDIPPTLNTNRW